MMKRDKEKDKEGGRAEWKTGVNRMCNNCQTGIKIMRWAKGGMVGMEIYNRMRIKTNSKTKLKVKQKIESRAMAEKSKTQTPLPNSYR